MAGQFPRLAPAQLLAHFLEPELLARWWAPRAEVEPRVGGVYHLGWPEPGWCMRGSIDALEPGESLTFTWRWDHDSSTTPARRVTVRAAPAAGGGSQLTVTHGPYTDDETGHAARRDHLAGWRGCLTILHGLPPA